MTISAAIRRQNVEILLPLYNKLFKLQRRVEKQFPHENIQWPKAIGLAYWNPLPKLKNGGYYCTPLNSLAFAWTGTEGEHFSFLVKNAEITARSPVILTVPSNYEGPFNSIKQTLCALVSGLLDLPPYFYTAAEFAALQQKYLPSLQMPEEFDEN